MLGEIVRSNEGIQKAAEDLNEGLVIEEKEEESSQGVNAELKGEEVLAAEDLNEGLVEEKKIESVPLDYKSMDIYRENYQGEDEENT